MTKTITIPVDAPALVRGVGFFETILVVRGEPILLEEHWRRLASGAESLCFPSPSREAFEREARRAATDVAATKEASVRVSWLAIGHDVQDARSWKLVSLSGPIPEGTLRRRRRGRVIVLGRHIPRPTPGLKTVSYVPSVLGLREAHERNADEALFTDPRGRILEGTTSNVFALRGDELITPPVSAGLLPGVMRGWVIARATVAGVKVRERLLTRSDLLAGSFLTGSLTKIAPVRLVDGVRAAAPGDLCRALAKAFDDELRLLVPR
jgi:branched-subunit amino acid aminotransferase/4-amino-4-deoxychorismate lyase